MHCKYDANLNHIVDGGIGFRGLYLIRGKYLVLLVDKKSLFEDLSHLLRYETQISSNNVHDLDFLKADLRYIMVFYDKAYLSYEMYITMREVRVENFS